MRKIFRFFFLFLAVLLVLELARGAVDIFLLRRISTHPSSKSFPVVRGAIHVHSRHSDGSGSVADIMQAAQRCSLDFVIITDHNNIEARSEDAERFWGRTLLIVGEEISTKAGHMLSLGAHRSHYVPELSDIPGLVRAIRADSGLSILAHPDHPRMRWKREDLSGADGMEIMNADVEWRNDSPREVIDALFGELVGLPGMHYLLDMPEENLRQWDGELINRTVIGIGSVDAHARIKLGGERHIGFPSYQEMFSLLNTFLILDEPLPSEPRLAQERILEALKRGRIFVALQGLGEAGGFEYYAEAEGERTLPQDSLFYDEHSSGSLRVVVPLDENFVVQLYRDGIAMEQSHSPLSQFALREPGVYRVVVFQERRQLFGLTRHLVPWIFSNPIRALPASTKSNDMALKTPGVVQERQTGSIQ